MEAITALMSYSATPFCCANAKRSWGGEKKLSAQMRIDFGVSTVSAQIYE